MRVLACVHRRGAVALLRLGFTMFLRYGQEVTKTAVRAGKRNLKMKRPNLVSLN